MEITIQNNGTQEIFVLDKVARQANGSLLYKQGKSVLLASVALDLSANIEGDFLPLTVQYLEKSYANGKIPGGYIKREGKPSEFEILTSRLIDRSLRPLFPKNFRYPVQITIIVLSVDRELDLQLLALNAASMALFVSNIPINRTLNSVRVAKIDDEFVVNPPLSQLSKSSIDLYISGENSQIFMIEFKSNIAQIDENDLLSAIKLAMERIEQNSKLYFEYLNPHRKVDLELSLVDLLNKEAFGYIKSNYALRLESCFLEMSKSENNSLLVALVKEIARESGFDEADIEVAIARFKREFIRNKILGESKRLDGRRLDEIREITIETNLLPNAHGSTLFTRGQTQVLAICTIGNDSDMQSYEMLTAKGNLKSNFMFHYNFPSFCTGEAYPIGAITRRELGHGNLARKALKSSIKDERRAIRIVAEVLESNGSSSMASVCGGSLSLYAAGLYPLFLVAGIAMGLVKEGDNYKILTDIMGIEDYDGDMDFKVAGNKWGITALQLDMKISDMTLEILQEALYRAKEARLEILEKMERAKEAIVLNNNAPKVEHFIVPQSKIPSIIGQGGRNIKEVIERFGVNIDINKDKGEIQIFGEDKEKLIGAKEAILGCVNKVLDFSVGEKFQGRIKKITDFGIFIELRDGIDGLVHNSKLLKNNIHSSNFSEGEALSVEIIAINNGKVELDLA